LRISRCSLALGWRFGDTLRLKVPRKYLIGQGGDDSSESERDGKFRIAGILPRRVRFLVLGLPESSYVKNIKFGGIEVEGQDLDLTSGGEMEVVLSPNGAEVGGTVRDADGKVMPSAVVQVCDKDGTIAKSTGTDQNGEFNIKGLAPGEYRVFSWEDRGDGIILDPDFRKSFERKTVAVKLAEKSRENVESVLIDKETMEVRRRNSDEFLSKQHAGQRRLDDKYVCVYLNRRVAGLTREPMCRINVQLPRIAFPGSMQWLDTRAVLDRNRFRAAPTSFRIPRDSPRGGRFFPDEDWAAIGEQINFEPVSNSYLRSRCALLHERVGFRPARFELSCR
jgi:hypothetical protein